MPPLVYNNNCNKTNTSLEKEVVCKKRLDEEEEEEEEAGFRNVLEEPMMRIMA